MSKIDQNRMVELILESCPSFLSVYEREAGNKENSCWWQDGKFSVYIFLFGFLQHLKDLFSENKNEELKKVFVVTEKILIEGDDFVQEAVIVGFFECLQNMTDLGKIDIKVLFPMLGPEGKKWWNKLNRFWQHSEILRDDD